MSLSTKNLVALAVRDSIDGMACRAVRIRKAEGFKKAMHKAGWILTGATPAASFASMVVLHFRHENA